MPIKNRKAYPKNWKAISNAIRFGRAGGRCERCGRPHGVTVWVSDDGSWGDPVTGRRYNDRGQPLNAGAMSEWPQGRRVKTILTCAHLDHDPTHNDGMESGGPVLPPAQSNLRGLCQRCHLRHDRLQHAQNAYRTRRRGKAIRDLFDDDP